MFFRLSAFLYFLISFVLNIQSSHAQDLGLESIAPLLGVSYAPEEDQTGFIACITTNFGELSRGIEVYPALSYWYAKKDDSERSSLQFSLDAKYFFAPTSGFYAGGGLSLNRMFEKSDGNSAEKTQLHPGGALFLGTEQFAGKNIWFLQLKFDIMNGYKAVNLSTGLFFDIYR